MERLEFELPDEREITPEGQQLLLEVRVTKRGIWQINLDDPDPWPSDPHADRVDGAEKLDLFTGEVFDKKTGKPIYKLSKKDMKFIFRKIMDSKEDSIKEKILEQKDKITYL